ncbi:hypothetical protein C8R47DRAFT_1097445 [Mycena vitilis]|nr:hypothetical protein C8R47DRAFT_1097445 [Mycena vitilis]
MDAAKASEESRPHNSSTIFSQLRSLTVGSLFNNSAASNSTAFSSSQTFDAESRNSCDLLKPPREFDVKGGNTMEDGVTPTPTRPSSPRRFPSVKSIFTNLASRSSRNTQPLRISVLQTQMQTEEEAGDETPRYELLTSPLDAEFTELSTFSHRQEPSLHSPSEYQQHLSASGSFGSSLDDTPPLTPESLLSDIALLSPPSEDAELGYEYDYDYNEPPHVEGHRQENGYMTMEVDQPNEQFAYVRPHSMEIKEGKKPARPIDFDSLLADISDDADGPDALLSPGDPNVEGSIVGEDDNDEWYGLEYTLELSTRERRASETHSSVGEHSKSRESWAAIHRGTVHPFFEDEEYYQWKNWHRYLDRQDEKRKHRRGRAFKAHAKDLAWFYADEMHTRDLMSWQTEVYGDYENDVLLRLRALESHRPDPYYPPQKHDIGWYLKRSRSVASLRELRPLPQMLQL